MSSYFSGIPSFGSYGGAEDDANKASAEAPPAPETSSLQRLLASPVVGQYTVKHALMAAGFLGVLGLVGTAWKRR